MRIVLRVLALGDGERGHHFTILVVRLQPACVGDRHALARAAKAVRAGELQCAGCVLARQVLIGALGVMHGAPHHRVFAHARQQRVHRLLHGAADVDRAGLDMPRQVGQLQHGHHAVDRHHGDAIDFGVPGGGQLRVGGEAVDIVHGQSGIRDGIFHRIQRVRGERALSRACGFRIAHAAHSNLASIVPNHGLLLIVYLAYLAASRNCGSVNSSFSFCQVSSTRRPTLASVYGTSSRLPAISAPGASSSSTMMLA